MLTELALRNTLWAELFFKEAVKLYELLSDNSYPVLALRVTLRMEAYRACSTSHSPNGSLHSLLYESLLFWSENLLGSKLKRYYSSAEEHAVAALWVMLQVASTAFPSAPVKLSRSGYPVLTLHESNKKTAAKNIAAKTITAKTIAAKKTAEKKDSSITFFF